MSSIKTVNNKRLAKNTLFLYGRSVITVIITLFTSRVILQVLGVSDFGIYNVVGGVVSMFSIISGALTHSISRFLNFEIGRGRKTELNKIFCTSLIILLGLSIIIVLCGIAVGLWFVNNKMNIPKDSLIAADWVLCCSFISFAVNLISIPYNSAIVAHEKMSAFAYISLVDALLKLVIAYLLYISPIDKLISYSILMVFESLILRSIYWIYCRRNFEECRFHFIIDKNKIKEMSGFAGWTFFTNGVTMLNNQGINILINLFFGVTINAARGIANQVESAVIRFVNDFTTAINPQLTQSYAAGHLAEMYELTCRGARFSYFLYLAMALPLLFEAPIIMKLWLKTVPEFSVLFFRLSVIGAMIRSLGNTGDIICMATGNIKHYVLIITSIGFLVFPLTWMSYRLGAPVESTYIIYIVIYFIVTTVRLWQMKKLTGFPPLMFFKDVYTRILFVSLFSCILPFIAISIISDGILRLVVVLLICEISIIFSIYFLGLRQDEKNYIRLKMKHFLR